MKFVKQTRFYRDDGRGNCVAAALASIFELDIDDVDVPDGTDSNMVMTWTNNRFPHLHCWIVDHGKNYRIAEMATDDEPWGRWEYDLPDEFEPPTQDLWMATVVSPRGFLTAGPYRGSPILHAIVMEGEDIAWDPYPDACWDTRPVVVQSTWWVPRTKPDIIPADTAMLPQQNPNRITKNKGDTDESFV